MTYPCNEIEAARCLRRKVRLSGSLRPYGPYIHRISDGVKCMQRPIDRALLSKLWCVSCKRDLVSVYACEHDIDTHRCSLRQASGSTTEECQHKDIIATPVRITYLVNCKLIISCTSSPAEMSSTRLRSSVSSLHNMTSRKSTAGFAPFISRSNWLRTPMLSTMTKCRRSGSAGSWISPGDEFASAGNASHSMRTCAEARIRGDTNRWLTPTRFRVPSYQHMHQGQSLLTAAHENIHTSSGSRYAGFSVTRIAPILAHAHCRHAYALFVM